ncbi:MAG: SMC-Scp complex subunit ScpB [Actinophytocola sp.]|uniref:SMC-Scp complex subunit ScpB n=1 Tax=Actinophytocola sp. TaxID=1872138 RepID=UPI003D6ACD03
MTDSSAEQETETPEVVAKSPTGGTAEPPAAAAPPTESPEPDAEKPVSLVTDSPTELAADSSAAVAGSLDTQGDLSAESAGESPSESEAEMPDRAVAESPAAPVAEAGSAPETEPSVGPADADPPTDVLDGADQAGEEVETDELPELDDAELEKALEALLLVVDSPVEEDVLAGAVGAGLDRVVATLGRMAAHLGEHERGLDLRRVGGGWRFYTRDKYAPYVEKMLLDGQRAKLTRAALETLAVIAYRQPVTRARVAAVRGVNCDGVIRTLLARGLVEEIGTDVETGGFLYRTTELFLERLGLSSLEDLPPIAPLLPEVDSIDDV